MPASFELPGLNLESITSRLVTLGAKGLPPEAAGRAAAECAARSASAVSPRTKRSG